MSVQAISWAMAHGPATCGPKFLLVALANYADEEGECWPSVARLAKDTAQDRRTVQRQLRELEADGFLSVLQPTDDVFPDGRVRKDKRPSLYRLAMRTSRGGVMPPRSPHGAASVQSRGGMVPPNPSSESDSAPPTPSESPERAGAAPHAAWSKEACDDWIEHHGRGSAHGGKIGRELKPLVTAHTWEKVRPAWKRYCEETKSVSWGNPANFREHYDSWASGRAHVNGNPSGHSESGGYDVMALYRGAGL